MIHRWPLAIPPARNSNLSISIIFLAKYIKTLLIVAKITLH
jgi:hypothetical protein